MRTRNWAFVWAAVVVGSAAWGARADEYAVDADHVAATFKIAHLGLSWTHGRFNDVSGAFTIDPDPAKCSFTLTLKADSIDTANKKRDEHLKSPDFFNVKQYPTISFTSKAVKKVKDGYQVTGDLTMHGETKSVTFDLLGGRQAEFPKGTKRTGYSADFVLKRSAYGMKNLVGPVGDDVHLSVSFEGKKK
jgi:polyisoprenoid-binding protein YceI